MTHIPNELNALKNSILEMGNLVLNQLLKSRASLENFDKELVEEIARNERRVDAYELKINMDCENILALFSPVANDLRFVLAALKTNYNLERIGDYAYNISTIVRDLEKPIDPAAIKGMRIPEMFETSLGMFQTMLKALEEEDTQKARQVFKKDERLDQIKSKSNQLATELIRKNPEQTHDILCLLSMIRKLERVGDQTKNMAEELIFHMEAKVLRHAKDKK
jgi:phosphate transport system protein